MRPSVYIARIDDHASLRWLRDEADENTVACVAMHSMFVLTCGFIRVRRVFASSCESLGVSVDIGAVEENLGPRWVAELLGSRSPRVIGGTLALAAARGVFRDLLVPEIKFQHRYARINLASPEVLAVYKIIACLEDTSARSDEVQLPSSEVFFPELVPHLNASARVWYLRRFVERALNPLIPLDTLERALEDAGVGPDEIPARLVAALRGEARRGAPDILGRLVRGDLEAVRRAGSRDFKQRSQVYPEATCDVFALVAAYTGVNLGHAKTIVGRSDRDRSGLKLLVEEKAMTPLEAERRINLFKKRIAEECATDPRVHMTQIVQAVATAWVDPSVGEDGSVAVLGARAGRHGALTLASLAQQVHTIATKGSPEPIDGLADIVRLKSPPPVWRRMLEALCPARKNAEIVWRVEPQAHGRYRLSLLTRSDGKLRSIAFQTAVERYSDLLGTAGCALARRLAHWHNLLDDDLADELEQLNGHLIEWLDGEIRTVQITNPTLHVDETEDGGFIATLEPPPELKSRIVPRGDRLVVYRCNPRSRALYPQLPGSFRVPPGAREEFKASLDSVRHGLRVVSTTPELSRARRLEADATAVLRLTPVSSGLLVSVVVTPLGKLGPWLRPGVGKPALQFEIGSEEVCTTRDLALEKEHTRPFVELLEGELEGEVRGDDIFVLLATLRDAGPTARAEWPAGAPMRLPQRVKAGSFDFESSSDRDWFSLRGEAKLEGGLLLAFVELVRGRGSRFVQLDDGTILDLEESLREQVHRARLYGDVRDDEIRFHSSTALAADADQLPLGLAWNDHVEDLRSRLGKSIRKPRGLDASLFPYQRDGFEWLSRLAELGFGACLADDMGLGKTLQSLALLLRRRNEGPALVIAPTSVCNNWHSEARRFTPTLNLIDFRSADRERALKRLKKGDVLVVSYALFRLHADAFAGVRFATAVLDEAQAIKNPRAQQSKAAFQIDAHARVVCTGTPIENSLTELWSLFRFLNPGLLGSAQSFRSKFIRPIEEDDEGARMALRARIGPFVLRRTKGEVLTELPEKSEVTHVLRRTPEEASFYEAVRQVAQERLTHLEHGERDRVAVLAELTKLRLACCDPQLVDPSARLPNTKISTLVAALHELRGAGHRALVFSQFVGYLKLIRTALESEGLRVLQLDGSTPGARRPELVRMFQDGSYDAFLISLKAGGTGLNLTAANYVFIMDPWWNPAVETQAADRTHRVGQTRSVTVVRYVAENTVEEGIIELHKRKQDLADAVLSGDIGSAKIDVETLIALVEGRA